MSCTARGALALSAVLLAAACSSGSSASQAPDRGNQEHARLVRAAHLRPCPTSSATSVSGGLPDVTLDCLGGGPAVHLAGLTGKPTVVNLWASWCGPCKEETPLLSSSWRAYRDRVRFLGVDTEDSADSALDFGAHVTPPVRYPSVVDPDKKVLIALAKAPGLPETAFLNAAGTVVHVHPGPYDSAAALRADIATYLHVR